MINILETIPPRKVSGISSLLVNFEYNPVIVETLKTIPNYYYHKKDYTWEYPINCLARLLDTLTFLDDITLTLNTSYTEVSKNELLSEAEISNFKLKPYHHQIEGINFGLAKDKWLLLDSMGLGKTNEIIWYAETLKRRGLIDHCLIVCGVNSVKQNWKKEIAKFSTESCIVLGERINKNGKSVYMSIPDRAKQLKDEIKEFFIITNIETLRSDAIIEAFNKSKNKFGLIAVDEIHKCASKSSAQGANLLKLKSDYKVAATGSLLTNSPISCYLPLAWTENDHATLTMYKAQYCEFGGFNNSQVIGYKNLDLLKDELESCMIRRTLDQVRDMPEKTITTELVEMDDEHKKFYEAIKQGVKEEADKIELKSGNLLALTTRLRQATASPSILTTQAIQSSKVERCIELVEELMEQNEKVVVLSVFREPIYRLAEFLTKYNPLVNTGDQSDDEISKNVDRFQSDPSYKLFLGTHQRVGTGLTLNSAAYLIMIDTPYTYAAFSQSTDRIYRINNTRPAFITVLACKDTIDERVLKIVETKKDLSDYIIDGKENALSQSLNDELRSILEEL